MFTLSSHYVTCKTKYWLNQPKCFCSVYQEHSSNAYFRDDLDCILKYIQKVMSILLKINSSHKFIVIDQGILGL